MNIYEAKDTLKKMFADKLVTFDLDENCIKQMECVMTEGFPNMMHHIEFDKIKISVEGSSDQYIPIQPHRENMTWSTFKKMISDKNQIYIHPDTIKKLINIKNDPNESSNYVNMINEIISMSGMTQDQIESKLK